MKKLKIVHLIYDEKFIDSAFEVFESVAPNCNDFFIPSKPCVLKYVKKTPVKFITPNAYLDNSFRRELERYDIIILHSLNYFNQHLVLNLDSVKVKLVWIGMGFDYYDIITDDEYSLLLEKTRLIAKNLYKTIYINHAPRWKSFIAQRLPTLFSVIMYIKKISYIIKKRRAIERINYFAPVLENEFDLVKSRFKYKFPEYIAWNYATNAHAIDIDCSSENCLRGSDILLGNSATLENNHIEAIDCLSEVDLKKRKVICPLSYGDIEYADIVADYGYRKLAENFLVVRNFLPFVDYTNLISKCSVGVFNHRRQQALGNIDSMIAKGAVIFLREENPAYQLYIKKGLKVFKIQDMEKDPHMLFEPLSIHDIKQNKNIIKEFRGMEIKLKMTRSLIETVLSDTK